MTSNPQVIPVSVFQLPLPLEAPTSPASHFERVFRRLHPGRKSPIFHIEFRPFASLRSSVVLHDHRAEVCISDVLREAPPIVFEALAEILLAKAFGRRPSCEARECYLAYVYSPATRRRADAARRERLRTRPLPPRGQCFDLQSIFLSLNRRYFNARLPALRIGWSLRPLRSVYGHYDPSRGIITISRGLDRPSVPLRLVEYMVFHEMLHSRFPSERRGDRRVIHSNAFREAERRFPGFERIRSQLKGLPD